MNIIINFVVVILSHNVLRLHYDVVFCVYIQSVVNSPGVPSVLLKDQTVLGVMTW